MHLSMLAAVSFGMEIDVRSEKKDLGVKHWQHGHSQELKCFSWWWGYELMVEELLKSHLTTRIVTHH
jgi:hypothetical protein